MSETPIHISRSFGIEHHSGPSRTVFVTRIFRRVSIPLQGVLVHVYICFESWQGWSRSGAPCSTLACFTSLHSCSIGKINGCLAQARVDALALVEQLQLMRDKNVLQITRRATYGTISCPAEKKPCITHIPYADPDPVLHSIYCVTCHRSASSFCGC